MIIDQVRITIESGNLDESEIKYYIRKIKKYAKGKQLKALELRLGHNFIDMRYSFYAFPFDRIRRVNLGICSCG